MNVFIRATAGHSGNRVNPDSLEQVPITSEDAAILWHGTELKHVKSILEKGILQQGDSRDQIYYNSVDPMIAFHSKTAKEKKEKMWATAREPDRFTCAPYKFHSEAIIAIDVGIAESFGLTFTQEISLQVLSS